jgi:hypothetical protein
VQSGTPCFGATRPRAPWRCANGGESVSKVGGETLAHIIPIFSRFLQALPFGTARQLINGKFVMSCSRILWAQSNTLCATSIFLAREVADAIFIATNLTLQHSLFFCTTIANFVRCGSNSIGWLICCPHNIRLLHPWLQVLAPPQGMPLHGVRPCFASIENKRSQHDHENKPKVNKGMLSCMSMNMLE